MKKIILSILLVFPLIGWSETIQPKNLVGVWVDAKPHSIRGKLIKWLASPGSYRLTISKDFDVIFQRTFDSGEEERIEVSCSELSLYEDLYIIHLPQRTGGKYKMVITGWESNTSKMLFGNLYLYNNEGLFNGWPISLVPEEGS
jgi:hypothetical protein